MLVELFLAAKFRTRVVMPIVVDGRWPMVTPLVLCVERAIVHTVQQESSSIAT